jgi:ribosome biogenesis GTPase A
LHHPHFLGVFPSIRSSTLVPLLCSADFINMDVSPEKLKKLCPQFRVLIMGRRNAGKTTILEKMTGSEAGAKPRIRDKEGRLVV